MSFLSRNHPLPPLAICALFVASAFSAHGFAQTAGNQAASENRVTVEPYTGPPIFLEEKEQVAPPKVVERKFAPPEMYRDSDQVRVEREIVVYSDNHFEADGDYREYYPDGQLFVEGSFSNGRQNGVWTYYHQNGKVNRKATYKDGQTDGSWEVYRADGTLAAKRAFSDGQRDREWIVYDASGERPIREEHYVRGKRDGVWKTWFPNGEPRQEVSFREGVKHGPSKEWNENGEVRADVNYVDGKLDGTATIVMPDGRKVIQEYEEGRLISN